MSEQTFDRYRLPDGSIVRIDASASKGLATIDFTLKGGAIVLATKVPESREFVVTVEEDITRRVRQQVIVKAGSEEEARRAITENYPHFPGLFDHADLEEIVSVHTSEPRIIAVREG